MVVALSFLGLTHAEAPSRSKFADNLLMTRRAWASPAGEPHSGLWLVDPVTFDTQRLRPFLVTNQAEGEIPRNFNGGDGQLAAVGDILTYQTWPGELQFDAFSWRLTRRLPASSIPDRIGWVVQGPVLAEAVAAGLGLAPGRYGNGLCLLPWIAPPSESFSNRACEASWPYPGVSEYPHLGSDSHMLFRPAEEPADRWSLLWSGDSMGWLGVTEGGVELPRTLTLDRHRRGFWRAGPREVLFLPVMDGSLGNASTVFDLGEPPFDRVDVEVERLYLHEASDMMFVLGQSVGFDNGGDEHHLLRLNPETGGSELLGSWVDGETQGAPSGFAALGPPPGRHQQLVPIVAAGPGARGTWWSTRLWLYNPSPRAVTVRLRRVTTPEQQRDIELPAHGSTELPDVLSWLGVGPWGHGAIHDAIVVSSDYHWGEQVVAMARISTMDPQSGGRFGHEVPAVPYPLGYSNHLPYLWGQTELELIETTSLDPSYLDLDLFDSGRYRANIGVVNDLDVELSLDLVWGYTKHQGAQYPGQRPAAVYQRVTVGPRGVRVVSLDDLFPTEVRDRFPPRIAVVGALPAVIWLSIVDNLTGDATFIPFTRFQLLNDSRDERLVIPAVARTAGRNGSLWRTDLVGPTWYRFPLDVIAATYRPSQPVTACGGEGASGAGISATLLGDSGMAPGAWARTLRELYGLDAPEYAVPPTGSQVVYRDVVGRFPPCAGDSSTQGALEVAVGNWTAGWSRTSTTRADGGTYGGMLPFYPPGGWPVQHFAGLEVGPEQRINVGLYNGIAEHAVTHRLLLYAADGTLAASREIVLEPHEHRQEPLARLVAVPVDSLPDGLYGLTVIPLDDPEQGLEGRSWAYVSLVDNRTNDPVNLW